MLERARALVPVRAPELAPAAVRETEQASGHPEQVLEWEQGQTDLVPALALAPVRALDLATWA